MTGVAPQGLREAEPLGDSHLGPAVALKLAAKRVNLSLEMLLPREEPILKQEAVLKISEGPDHTRQVGGHTLGEPRKAGVRILALRGDIAQGARKAP